MATIYDQTELTAEGVTSAGDVWIGLHDKQSGGNSGKKMSMSEAVEYVEGNLTFTPITWSSSSLPAADATKGLYGVLTGTYRGFYLCTGAERIRLAEFSQDGV